MWLERVEPHGPAITADGTHPWRRMPLGRTTALVLLLCLTGLSTLAHASPPDPIWLPGLYDGADADDVVALLCDSTALAPPLAELMDCGRSVVGRATVPSVSPARDLSLLGSHPRSPPSTPTSSR